MTWYALALIPFLALILTLVDSILTAPTPEERHPQ